MTGPHHRPDVAVIGSGVAGLTAAWVMTRSANVTLYEADTRLGGHADTHDVALGNKTVSVDTGFIVHNERTYPVLMRLFRELGVATRDSEMSMSIRDDETQVEWAGALGLRGLFPTPAQLTSPSHWRMLVDIPRFHRRARRLLASGVADDRTLDEFLDDGKFNDYFRRHFAQPLVSAVWSCDPMLAMRYPALYLFTFLQHHGMLAVFGSPRWKTVVGGSRTYVEKVAAAIGDVQLGVKVTCVAEDHDGIEITDGNGETRRFDAVVIATHPGQALDLLAAPTPLQHEVLATLTYTRNPAVLHSDDSVLPRAHRAQASWNFRRSPGQHSRMTVTYDLGRLQGIQAGSRLLLTLDGEHVVDPSAVLEHMEYEHPLYTPESVAAQRRLPTIDTDRIVFAGAYHGWGFHEDGARSGLAAAERLGFSWGPQTGVYRTSLRHTRRRPFRRSFEHRSWMWLVDVDDLPDHGGRATWLGTFEARDHLGDPHKTLRANVESFLTASGCEVPRGRILMAAQPRAWGHCFNPISLFWCLNAEGAVAATVVEVHNTYGERHAYVIHPDDRGRGDVAKAMYVSPFHGTDGTYSVTAPLPTAELNIAVSLRTDDGAVFSASLTGVRAAGPAAARRAAYSSIVGSLLIRMHGLWLWTRRLPVQPRPPTTNPE